MFASVLLKLATDVDEADILTIHAPYSKAHPIVDSASGKKGIRVSRGRRIGHKKTSLNLKLYVMAAFPDACLTFPFLDLTTLRLSIWQLLDMRLPSALGRPEIHPFPCSLPR